MKKLAGFVALCCCVLFSGCTVAHFTYIRNLTEHTAEISFTVDLTRMKSIPDSINIPFSPTAHRVNKNTYTHMTDSIVAKRYPGSTMKLLIPSGGMIMIDKNTSRKIGYYEPEKIKVKLPGKEEYTVVVSGAATEGQRRFQEKGRVPRIAWFDIY